MVATTLVQRVTDLATRAATESKSLRTLINGNASDLTALTTTAKGNLVLAVNETIGYAKGIISDASATTTNAYSSSKVVSVVNAATAALINDAAIAPFPTTTTLSASKINSNIAALISDTAASSTTTYSSTKINSNIAALINDTTASATTVYSSNKTISIAQSTAAALINDASALTATATTYSANKINSQITTAVNGVVNGAGTALDTLKELADAIGNDASFASTVTSALGNRLRIDVANQALTAAQQLNGRTNLDAYGSVEIGNPDTNFVTIFNNALV